MSTITGPVLRLRPRAGLLGTAAVTSLLATVPLFGVLYGFGARAGTWPEVLLAHAVVVVGCLAVGLRQLTVFVEVRDGRLRGNGIFSPLVEVELDRIARVDLVDTYAGLAPRPVRQLLVRDAAGARLFRMRGNYWHDGDLEKVADALPVAPITVTEPIDLRDFYRDYPGSAYWFEDRRAVTVVAIALGLLAAGAGAAVTMLLTGEPTIL